MEQNNTIIFLGTIIILLIVAQIVITTIDKPIIYTETHGINCLNTTELTQGTCNQYNNCGCYAYDTYSNIQRTEEQ